MKIQLASAAITCGFIALAGCGGGDQPPPPQSVTTQIYSDSSYDGDIALSQAGTYTVTQGMSSTVQSVFAGIDPATGAEYRAFLDFSLTGPTGIPGNAVIQSATLEIDIASLQPASGSLPIQVDLVAFQPPNLVGTDYDPASQPALASITVSPNFTAADVGTLATLDITPLMEQAQRQQLVDFQVRLMEPAGPGVPVIMEIADPTGANRNSLAPLLTVTYF